MDEAAGRFPGTQRAATIMRPEGPREPSPGSGAVSNKTSRGPSGRGVDRSPVTQGIGLWPKPWAPISRPVGPVAVPRLLRGKS